MVTSTPSARACQGHRHSHHQPSPGNRAVLAIHPTAAPVALPARLLLQLGSQPGCQFRGQPAAAPPAPHHFADVLLQQPPLLLSLQRPHSSQPQPHRVLVAGVPAELGRGGRAADPPTHCSPTRLQWAPCTPLLTSPRPQCPGSSGGPCRWNRCCSGFGSTQCNTTLGKMGHVRGPGNSEGSVPCLGELLPLQLGVMHAMKSGCSAVPQARQRFCWMPKSRTSRAKVGSLPAGS